MLLKSRYPSFDQIPEFARGEYEQQGTEWVLKQDAIEGGAAHFNPGLAANRDALRTEKDNAISRAQTAENRAAAAEARVATLTAPGSVTLSENDAKAWKAYLELGDVKTVKGIVAEHGELKGKLGKIEAENNLRTVAEAGKLNFDVLRDQMALPGRENIALIVKDVQVTDAAGQQSTVKKPFVVISTPGANNTVATSEQELATYAQANWPAYVVAALQQTANGQQQQQFQQPQFQQPVIGQQPQPLGNPPLVRMPNMLPSNQGNNGQMTEAQQIADQFNKARDTRPNPLAPKQASAQQ